jgi:hypothetical protein
MALSSRYPQLICILMRFFTETRVVERRSASRASCLTKPERALCSSIQNQALRWPAALRDR